MRIFGHLLGSDPRPLMYSHRRPHRPHRYLIYWDEQALVGWSNPLIRILELKRYLTSKWLSHIGV